MKDKNCIFCKIANGEISTNSIYENDRFRVILDSNPATKGHALILPKNHYENLFVMPQEEAGEAIQLAQKIGSVQMERLQAKGLNLVQNNGAAAGQTVEHFHIHLIPRYDNDGQTIGWKPGSPSADELCRVRDLLI